MSASPRSLVHEVAKAPRSLFHLSSEHPNGWGVARHDGAQWLRERSVRRASEDPSFEQALSAQSRVWIAHIRLATVGRVELTNTHPFVRDRVCFAHNGTLSREAFAWLSAQSSPSRLSQCDGDTDSERLLSYLLTTFDAERSDERFIRAMMALAELPEFGAANVLLADEQTLYACRLGRSLWRREDGVTATIASEPYDDHPSWSELPERSFWRVDVSERPTVRQLTL